MAQTKIIVDTNSYFRLAQNIHPLLCHPFGEACFTLYIHTELNSEFKRSHRLQNKFHWFSEKRYSDNRSRSISLTEAQKEEIEDTCQHLLDYVLDEFLKKKGKGPSPVDARILATASVLKIQAVTDDQDMIELAEVFEIPKITSLGLMKLMLVHGRIDDEKIDQVVQQWMYDNDTPHRNWKKEFKKLFGRKPPDDY